ncbi:MAG: 2-C-methyl-D-erythritol 4-phosphate cytidylyltransferase [Bacteroidales bacterium]|nr:2-C-methyl-D-erythritol 4-phosphate cytidylyltransferase [Bacteroidales bacterium]MCR4856875.1 2-C-methyl-D-erythritol 4-phosphate cytidylyltransferase [Bacteroidales bacterium]
MQGKFTFLLLSGGVGLRMHNAIPKQYMLLAGKPIIMHILERVDRIETIHEIIIVCVKEFEATISLMAKQYSISKNIRYAPAGITRQESVRNGLALVNTDDVIIHEAARPFVKVEDFERLISIKERNATFGSSIPFTVLKGHDYVEGLTDRKELVNVQLPQKFETSLLKNVHEKAASEGREFTEDAGMIFFYHPEVPIKIVEGMDYDIKLTTRIDMLAGEQIYNEEFSRRK